MAPRRKPAPNPPSGAPPVEPVASEEEPGEAQTGPTTPTRLRKGTRRAMDQLLRSAGRLGSELDAICDRHGITRDQHEVLRILQRAGDEGLSRRELSRHLAARAPDVTRLLDRLQRRELVARLRTDSDRRLSLSRITPSGAALMEQLRPDVDAALGSFAAPLPGKELRRLARLLKPLSR